jgi:hypothetical protein
MEALKARVARVIAWLCRTTDAHVRGWCRCPLCDQAEQGARALRDMPARHPESLTRDLGDGQDEWLAAIAAGLWPADEYTTIIDTPWREDES